jgi:predicted nucleotide-binding protein
VKRMPKSKQQFHLPFNTPFDEIEMVLDACRQSQRGVSQSEIRKLLRIADRTLQYKKYALFWTEWIAEENGKFFLTDSGAEYLQASDQQKRELLRRQIKRYPPYRRPLQLIHQEGVRRMTKDFIQRVWRKEFAIQILWDLNPQRFERAPRCFIEICRAAGLGRTIAQDGAHALEVNRDGLKEYIELIQKVFIGHGRNRVVLKKVATFIEDACGLIPIVVEDLPDKFRHISTKVRKYMKAADYFVFLFTGDDVLKTGEKRARQNVINEIGIATQIRKSNICGLVERGVEFPSNLQGVLIKYFEGNKVEPTFSDVRREMRAANIDC